MSSSQSYHTLLVASFQVQHHALAYARTVDNKRAIGVCTHAHTAEQRQPRRLWSTISPVGFWGTGDANFDSTVQPPPYVLFLLAHPTLPSPQGGAAPRVTSGILIPKSTFKSIGCAPVALMGKTLAAGSTYATGLQDNPPIGVPTVGIQCFDNWYAPLALLYSPT